MGLLLSSQYIVVWYDWLSRCSGSSKNSAWLVRLFFCSLLLLLLLMFFVILVVAKMHVHFEILYVCGT